MEKKFKGTPVKIILKLTLIVSVFGVSIPQTKAAQRADPLTVEDALDSHSFAELSPLAYSPNGVWIAYAVAENKRIQKTPSDDAYARTGVPQRANSDEIWISNCETGEKRNLTEDQGSNWDPVWSPDGRYLAFLSDRDGQARLWMWNSTTDKVRRISGVAVRASALSRGIEWTGDSKHILITTIPQQMTLAEYVDRVSAHSVERPESSAVPRSTVTLYSAGDGAPSLPAGNLDAEYLADLALVDVASGDARAIVRGRKIGWHSLSPDGSRVAFASPTGFKEPGSFMRVYDLATVDVASAQEHVVASGVLLDDVFSWSPDGSFLSFGAYGGDELNYSYSVVPVVGGPAQRIQLPHDLVCCRMRQPMWGPEGRLFYFLWEGALWRASVSDGRAKEVSRIAGRSIEYRISRSDGQLWTIDGGKSTVVLTHDDEGKQDGFYKVDLTTGRSTVLLERAQCYRCKWRVTDLGSYLTGVSPDQKHVAYISEDAQHAPDLWESDADFRNPHQLTHMNPQFERYKMGRSRIVDWLSDDGERLHGALLLPSDYEPGNKYPLIVWVYPARLSDWVNQFGLGQFPGPFNMQLFATRGYAVLLPDVHEHFAEPLASLASSALPGVNKLIEMGIADPQRLAVMGHSAGGNSVLALLVQTTEFKAAMVAAGSADLTALYGEMDQDGTSGHSGGVDRMLGGTPWQRPLSYVQNSPVYYLDKVETPLLLVFGSADNGGSSLLSDEVFVGMRRLGKRIEYAKYQGEGHVPQDWGYANQFDLCQRVLAWLDTYLGKKAN
ncbi:MAG: prolyl oligopeptidase family serine peptidase [Candidatus Acidiferrales bacterium]